MHLTKWITWTLILSCWAMINSITNADAVLAESEVGSEVGSQSDARLDNTTTSPHYPIVYVRALGFGGFSGPYAGTSANGQILSKLGVRRSLRGFGSDSDSGLLGNNNATIHIDSIHSSDSDSDSESMESMESIDSMESMESEPYRVLVGMITAGDFLTDPDLEGLLGLGLGHRIQIVPFHHHR